MVFEAMWRCILMIVFHLPLGMAADTFYKCAVYNRLEPTLECNDLASCEIYDVCKFCSAVYFTVQNSSELRVQKAGCIEWGHECKKAEGRDGRCVLEVKVGNAHYCCCYGDYCNKNVTTDNLTSKTTADRKTSGRTLELKGKGNYKKLLYYILPFVFGVVVISALLHRLWQNRKEATSLNDPLSTVPPQSPPVETKPTQFREIIRIHF